MIKEGEMDSTKQQPEPKKEFEPLEIMGIFWLFFGTVVLIATFFIKETSNVPLIRGVVTNVLSALLLLGAGIFSFVKGRANKRRKGEKS